MKKLLQIILLMICTFALCIVSASAIEVSPAADAAVSPGSSFMVMLSLDEDAVDIYTMELRLYYDQENLALNNADSDCGLCLNPVVKSDEYGDYVALSYVEPDSGTISSGTCAAVSFTAGTSSAGVSVQIGCRIAYIGYADEAGTELDPDIAPNSIVVSISKPKSAPEAPALTSAVNGSKGVIIKWNAVDDAAGYYVYRKVNGGSWSKVRGTTATSYTDTTALTTGTTYYYTVRAVNDEGTLGSYDRTGISVKYVEAVQLTSVTNTASGTTVNWSAVDGASSYIVYRRLSGGSWSRLGAVKSTSYSDSTLTSGTTYYYTVRAVYGGVTGCYSAGKGTVWLSVPTMTSASNGVKGVTVKWETVNGADSYLVFRKTSGGSWKQLGTASGTTYSDTSASSGTTYFYTVRAVSGSYKSSYDTNGKSVLYLSAPAISGASNAAGNITVKWSAVTGASSYIVYRKTTGSWKQIGTTTGTSYKDTSVDSGTSYTYTVRAVSGSVKSGYDTVGCSIEYLSVPALSNADVQSGQITVRWEAVSGASEYTVYRKISGGSWKKIGTSVETTFTDTSVTAGTTYYYTVRAVNGSSSGYYNTVGIKADAV